MPGAPAGAQGRTLARQTFEALYDIAPDGPVAASGKEAFAAVEMLERKLSGRTFRPGEGGYPAAPIGQSLRLLAALIQSEVGLRVGFVKWAAGTRTCSSSGSWRATWPTSAARWPPSARISGLASTT